MGDKQGKTSPMELEKLKKKLLKLFQKRELFENKNSKHKQSLTEVGNEKKLQSKNKNSKTPKEIELKKKQSQEKTAINNSFKGRKKQQFKRNKNASGNKSQQNEFHKVPKVKPINNLSAGGSGKMSKFPNNQNVISSVPQGTPLQTQKAKKRRRRRKSKFTPAIPNKTSPTDEAPKVNIKQKKNKNVKKRTITEVSPKEEPKANKKPRLTGEENKIGNKKKKRKYGGPLSKQGNKYQVKEMEGLVHGGDFDTNSGSGKNNMEQNWMQQGDDREYQSSEQSDRIELKDNEDDYNNEVYYYSNSEELEDMNSDTNEENERDGDIELYEHFMSGSDRENEYNKDNYSKSDEEKMHQISETSKHDEESNHIKLYKHCMPNSGSEGDFNDNEYYCGSEKKEEANYSDYGERDYRDEANYNYSVNRKKYSEGDERDDAYNPPKSVSQDLIVQRDNVLFSNDYEEDQIVELRKKKTAKVIKHPGAYDKKQNRIQTFSSKEMIAPNNGDDCPRLIPTNDGDVFQRLYGEYDESIEQQSRLYDKKELAKPKYSEQTMKKLILERSHTQTVSPKATIVPNVSDDCLELIPTSEEDSFQRLYSEYDELIEEQQSNKYNPKLLADENDDYDMGDIKLDSEYMEINSENTDSLLSEDINEKYLNRVEDSYSTDYENIWTKKHNVDIIDATNCNYIDKKEYKSIEEDSKESLQDNIIQLPSMKMYKNVDLETESSILSARIYNKMVVNLSKLKTQEPKLKESIAFDKDNESNTVDDTSLENILTHRVKSSSAQKLTNYNTKFFNALDSNLVLIILKDPFYIYGTVRLTLLAGSVEVYGHSLILDKEVEIFSPRGSSIIEITPSIGSKTNSNFNLNNKLKNYEKSFALADLHYICDSFNHRNDAVVLLKRNETRKKVVQQFKKFMNENVFPNLNNINIDRPLYNTEYLLRCMINTSPQKQKCLCIPQQWQELSINSQSRVMVTGGKGVGKSTLIRYLINRNMPQQVLLIDLDIGQPEVFIPQTISCSIIKEPLLGPGFMLNLEPEFSYVIGHTNIVFCAHKYIEAVRSLIAHCMNEEKYQELPWLINTMGYNKGFGLELLSVIAKELSNLTDIIQLQSSKEINNFDTILLPHVLRNVPRNIFMPEEYNESSIDIDKTVEDKDYRLHVCQSAVQQESRYQKEWEMSAKDLRFAILLSRLSQALQGHAEWLTDCKPLSAPLDQLKIVNLLDNTPLATAEDLAKSVEANLVYLCHYQEDNKPLKCLGIGVVRAIDFHIRQVYLLPALPYTVLEEVNCLALGEMPLSTSIFTNQGPRIRNTAPFVYNTIAANASKGIKQIYHRPRHFLTGRHKSLD